MLQSSANIFVLIVFGQILIFLTAQVSPQLNSALPEAVLHDHGKQEHHKQIETKQNSSHSKDTSTNIRSKRQSIETDDELSEDKRVRDFVGKRFHPGSEAFSGREKVIPLDLTLVLDYPSEHTAALNKNYFHSYDNDDSEINNEDFVYNFDNHRGEKRLRDFIGKRSNNWNVESWSSYNKRLRDFIGKRGDYEGKRLREFLGKRDQSFVQETGESSYENVVGTQKRPREFVGKRSGSEDIDQLILLDNIQDLLDKDDQYSSQINAFPPEILTKHRKVDLQNDIDKRLREFLGKRTSSHYEIKPYVNIQKRIRDFVGKRDDSNTLRESKRIREFVGKREDGDMLREDKRIREFIGKREDKRPREFVGKRSLLSNDAEDGIEEEKRVRDFVGKRWDDENIEENKRPREFVGKRFDLENEPEEAASTEKRLREFVGKRNYVSDLDSSVAVKRIREFIGRR